MKTYLKIKIASLAAEARLIKREEKRWWKPVANRDVNKPGEPLRIKVIYKKDHPLVLSLREHRIHSVRAECRSAHIAYGYMRGRAYKQIENKCYEHPNWDRIADIVRTFSGAKYTAQDARKQLADDLKAWSKQEAIAKAA